MRFGVLGPLAVWTTAGNPVAVPERKVRALLADLLVHAGQPVSASRLIDDLWGEQLPVNPTNTLQTRVSQLRRALAGAEPGGRELVVSQAPGYLLRVEPQQVDAGQFRALLGRARAAGDPGTRAGLLADALALWRGPAYADVEDEPFARAAIDRLAEERLVAIEEQADARLALGEHPALVGELADLVGRHPLRQRLRAAYMQALYRSGRHSEALDCYADLRDLLAGQLGLDPGEELVALQQAILRQDPALAAPVRAAPATRSPGTNLPTPLTSLIGRDEAVREVRARLVAGRLVTLTGPGGVGKTRLAVAVADQLRDEYPDGVWLVELAAIGQRPGASSQEGSPMPVHAGRGDPFSGPELAAELVRSVAAGLRRSAEDPDQLADQLRDRQTLLVLDNCEHLTEPVAALAGRLLQAAPGLRVLTTSREPLEIPGEQVWEVPPLGLPDPATVAPAELERASAVQLFVARAAATAPGFRLGPDNAAAVASICRRLDGLPLALELAATRVRGLGVHEVADRLGDRFRLLSAGLRGAPARQQTLQAVIDWSWGLLSAPERTVLRRLSLHADTFTLAAAAAISADDGTGAGPDAGPGEVAAEQVPELLSRLVDRSLVVRLETPEGARYRLLESVSAYGLARLHETGEFPGILQRHVHYYIRQSLPGPARL